MAKRRLTEAQIADMLKMYQGDTPIGEIVKKFGLSSDTIHKYRERAGIPKRSQAESVALWRKANGIEATRQPARLVKAGSTPREKWVDVADMCQKCAAVFSMCAPAHVAERVHMIWRDRHSCEVRP